MVAVRRPDGGRLIAQCAFFLSFFSQLRPPSFHSLTKGRVASHSECQHADHKEGGARSHKKTCGKKPDLDVPPVAPQKPKINKLQKNQLDWIDSYPRAIFAATVQVENKKAGWGPKNSAFFPLPLFVRPFFDILRKLKEIRLKALETKDETSIGIIARFIQLDGGAVQGTVVGDGRDDYVGHWAMLLGLEDTAALQCAQKVSEKGEDFDPLVRSCFAQLISGKAECVSSTSPSSTLC